MLERAFRKGKEKPGFRLVQFSVQGGRVGLGRGRPRPPKRALAYVLSNARKHRVWSSPTQPDPFSSGRWYSGWFGGADICRPLRAPPVAKARDMYLTMQSFRNLSVSFTPGERDREGEPLLAVLAI